MNFGQPTAPTNMFQFLIITNTFSDSGTPTVIIDGTKLDNKKWKVERKEVIDHIEAITKTYRSDRSSSCNAEAWSMIVIKSLRRFKTKSGLKSSVCNPYRNRWQKIFSEI